MVICAVINCSNRSVRDSHVSFFSFPRIIENKGQKIRYVSDSRRKEWIMRIHRADMTNLQHKKVCSEHFISGKPSDLMDQTNPDWAPSLKLGHTKYNVNSEKSNIWYKRSHFSKKLLQTSLSSRNMTSNQWPEPKELRIPIPYGHMAAKVWGNEGGENVLALHGWQDNAGTFDKLIPLLTNNLHIVALDAPGHGMSSHKPPGAFYHLLEMLVDIKRAVDYLKWNKFSLLGHSMGGILSLLFSSCFPEYVKNIVLLDIIKPASRTPELLPDLTRSGVESLLNVESKMSNSIPVYSMEEAQSRLMSVMEITPESALILLKRGCKPSRDGKGFVFSRDIRLRVTEDLHKPSHEDLKAFMRRIKCNMLIVLANKSVIHRSRTPEVLDDFLKIYEENCQYFEISRVDGNHFVHINDPELVAPAINNFFSKTLQSGVSKI